MVNRRKIKQDDDSLMCLSGNDALDAVPHIKADSTAFFVKKEKWTERKRKSKNTRLRARRRRGQCRPSCQSLARPLRGSDLS